MSVMLTTTDNPYNPFTQYDEWLAYDVSQGYYTNEYLARIAHLSDALSTTETDEEIERAIDEIVSLNTLGIYKKVSNVDEQSLDDNEK